MKTITILFIVLFTSCSSRTDCSKIPNDFASYQEAKAIINSTHFAFIDKVNTSKSSWIRSAKYYSCDSKTGFFIFETDKHAYIHRDMPIRIWYGFKDAESYGSYYNRFIKHRYQLLLAE